MSQRSPTSTVRWDSSGDASLEGERIHPSEGIEVDRTRICVGIATRGRPGLIAALVERIRRQSLVPTTIIISASTPSDIAGLPCWPDVTVLMGTPGLARQRNLILRHVPHGTDVVAFFDDDFVPHADWLASVARTFRDHSSVACITGHVIADGIIGPGIPFSEACALADADRPAGHPDLIEDYSPYGCNMAFRCTAIEALQFDERLVLYGWLEDRDFGGALARNGWRLVRICDAQGVHMGLKQGRMPGQKLGYSQVMNPIYMIRKGTTTWKAVGNVILRNVAANLLRSMRPEPYVDRWGRLRGNMIAMLDLCRGRLTPERAEGL